jgi:hypothetical protein
MKISELLQEGLWDRLKSGAKMAFTWAANAIKKLNFGQRTEINLGKTMGINTLTEANSKDRDNFDLTSIIGYYNEYSVAWKLAYGLEMNGVNVKPNVDDGLRAYAEQYKKYILDNIDKFKKSPQEVMAEIQRAEDGSEIMAKKMWQEIVDAHDLKLIDVEIGLTGKSAAGLGKEDILIVIKKRGTEEVKDMIKASLKLYKTASGVNVYNSTFASYLVTVLTGKDDPVVGKKAVKSFLDQYPQYTDDIEQVLAITDEWKKIKTRLKKEKNPDYRKAANEFVTANRGYQKMRDLLFKKMFNDLYPQNKAAINERILNRLGLDGADDVYLLVGTDRQKMVAVSSRTSQKFADLYRELKAGFNMRYEIPDDIDIATCYLIIESEQGQPLAKFTIAFKEGGTFPHMWNMSDIVADAKRSQTS